MSGETQKLSIVHAEEGEFLAEGLRAQFAYRDLGVKGATGGRFHAHLIRAQTDEGPKIGLHRHTGIDFQLVYILNGWMKFWYDDGSKAGVETVARKGTCIIQPPGIPHAVLAWSEDLELLEVTSPENFGTETLSAAAE